MENCARTTTTFEYASSFTSHSQHILVGLQIPSCCVKKNQKKKNRHYYQLLKQTFTRKSPRDAPANTFSGKSCKYHLHGQQRSAKRGARTRTESHANSKDDMGGGETNKKNKEDAEFRTKSTLTGTEKLSSVVRN